MTSSQALIAYLTAGAGGMLCGSCLHDNTLARALIRRGVDVQLIPTYTPIRTDEDNVSEGRVFLGGINVFLAQQVPGYRFLPAWLTRVLDHPALIRWATSRASATSAAALGELTLSMLRGADGRQRREMEQLCRWLVHEVRPQLIVLSNVLIAGCVPRLKQLLNVPVLATLQGDDIFLESLAESYRLQARAEVKRLVTALDGFFVNSRYYADFMREYLDVPADKLHLVPLGIDVSDFAAGDESNSGGAAPSRDRSPIVGYLARLAPEKGLHLLVDAFIELRRRGTAPAAKLHVAGWMGENQRGYVDEQRAKLARAGLEGDVQWFGEVDRRGKIDFLRGIDLLSVPTVYREPKGLFVLEAMAAGVPVLQPAHGAFPEMLTATGGGQLFPPSDLTEYVNALERLLTDHTLRQQLGREGRVAVHTRFHADAMAAATWDVLRPYIQVGST